jgi:hypothetical protein
MFLFRQKRNGMAKAFEHFILGKSLASKWKTEKEKSKISAA